ncbi:MAG: spore cortex biosynthesis protein YabQ [Clostridia bacterium]|nr:spore cortex biosynthesis protein YabQ [Clostridia bacterium]
MDNIILSQLYSLLIFTITGIIIGVFFDIFRILRRSFKTPDIITYIEDVLFWVFTGIFFITVLFKFNNGEIRSYVLLGLILGIIVYMLSISKYFIKINIAIIKIIKKILAYPIRIILKIIKPFSFIVINIRKIIVDIYNKILKTTKKYKKIGKNT